MIAKCPYCQFAYTITQEHVGLTSVCQNCHQHFVIAEYAQPPQTPPPQYYQPSEQARPREDFAGPAAQEEPPASGKLSRTMAKAQAKADAEAKAQAKAEAKAQAKAAKAAAKGGGGKSPLLAALLVLVLLGGGAFFRLVHQPAAAEVKRLAEANSVQAAQISRLNGQLKAFQKDQGEVPELKALHENLQKDIAYYAAEMTKYLGDSIYYQLAASIVAETRLLDILIQERINALESGAKITVQVSQSAPNEELAKTLEEQMGPLGQHIADAERAIDPNDQSLSGSTQRLALENDKLTLATLRRNYYIAKYGLNTSYGLNAGVDTKGQPEPAKAP